MQPNSELCMDTFQVGQAEQRHVMQLLAEKVNNDGIQRGMWKAAEIISIDFQVRCII